MICSVVSWSSHFASQSCVPFEGNNRRHFFSVTLRTRSPLVLLHTLHRNFSSSMSASCGWFFFFQQVFALFFCAFFCVVKQNHPFFFSCSKPPPLKTITNVPCPSRMSDSGIRSTPLPHSETRGLQTERNLHYLVSMIPVHLTDERKRAEGMSYVSFPYPSSSAHAKVHYAVTKGVFFCLLGCINY